MNKPVVKESVIGQILGIIKENRRVSYISSEAVSDVDVGVDYQELPVIDTTTANEYDFTTPRSDITLTHKISYNAQLSDVINSRKEYMIVVRAQQDKRFVDIPTDIYVPKDCFKDGLVTENHDHCEGLNAMLTKIIMDIEAMEIEAFKHGTPITTQKIYSMYVEHLTISTPLLEFTEQVLKFSSNRREITKTKYRTIVKLINDYEPEITLEDIDLQWLKRYEKHCLDKGNSESTVYSAMKVIRTIFNEAIKRDLIKPWETPFRLYTIPEMRSRNDVLRFIELEKLQSTPLKRRNLNVTRDLFLFSAYTGLRWADLISVTSDDIRKIGDVVWLIKKTQKTGQLVQVPISIIFFGKLMLILNKYKKVEDLTGAFHCNSSYNRCLKDVLEIAGVGGTQHITIHTARRSCITGLADFGVNVYTIQRIVGHRRITTTQKYMQLSMATLEQDIRKAFPVSTTPTP